MPMLNVKASGFPHPEISKKNAALTRGADCHRLRNEPRRECSRHRLCPIKSMVRGRFDAQRAGQEERVA
jgi:hypothetical protein